MIRKKFPRLRKPCKRCGDMFRPTGRHCFICDNCLEKVQQKLEGGKKLK